MSDEPNGDDYIVRSKKSGGPGVRKAAMLGNLPLGKILFCLISSADEIDGIFNHLRGPDMRKRVLFLLVVILLLLFWAHWLNDQEIHERVFKEKASIDGTINKETGEQICDYSVRWTPFGRWVASCEGGYIVTFYGQLI